MGFSGGSTGPDPNRGFGDSGSAARFFYCAKASKRDRDEGCEGLCVKDVHRYGAGIGEGIDPNAPAKNRNHHPTVKPTDLMRYLCRLVTPPNGTVLDPFMGSGSTGKAAILEGFRFIGIEREAEYLEIARARIDHVTKEPNLWQS
jgi:site-specific DNA-methyltransferase (adenine-specific)